MGGIVAGIDMAKAWIHLLEQGADEEKGPVTREASARSITSSKILSWVTIQAKRENGDHMVEHSGEWSVLAVRVWVTALKLMQDDDEDIRDIIGTSINEIENTSVFQNEENNERNENIRTKSYDLLKNFMPQNFNLVQGFMLDRMGFLISDALVWSLATNTASMKSSGLHVVLTEYQRLIGTKDATRAILQADGNTLNEKIFEAEQSNLHIEPLVGAHVLAVAVAETAKRLTSTTNTENHAFQEGRNIIIAAMNQYIQDAQSMMNEDQVI